VLSQLKDCRTQITVLLSAAEKQASEFESKLKAVEIKLEERKCQHSTPKAGKLKGTGSTFTCIGMGHQVHSELAEDRISYELRIQELETLLSSQHKENSMLNDKLVEAEKMTYDVVHDLLGVKSNISNVVTLLGQQQAELLLQNGCNNSPDDAQEKEEALENLTSQLNDFIQERESWLEEIKQKQAEVLAARLSTDKLRERDKRLIEENNKFKAESIGQQKRIGDLEQEMRKLSGQQNLQQRIQHHAKIKDENNALRIQNDELSGKLRRAELLYARVNDELSKYRSADGKQPFLDIDEEQRLCNMLQVMSDGFEQSI
jgi:kinesin family protein 15